MRGNLGRCFTIDSQYSELLQQAIRRYHAADDLTNFINIDIFRTNTIFRLNRLANISRIVHGASLDSPDITFRRQYLDFNQELLRIKTIYNGYISLLPVERRNTLQDERINEQFANIVELRALTPPAPDIPEPAPIPVNVPESGRARGWKYVGYGLYAVSTVTGAAAAGHGVDAAMSWVTAMRATEEVAREAAKSAAINSAGNATTLALFSAVSGTGGYFAAQETSSSPNIQANNNN